MNRLLSLATAALFAAPLIVVPMSAATQGADPALEAFKKVCWNSVGKYTTVVQSAANDGWTDTAVKGQDDNGISITDKSAKDKAINGLDVTLLASQGIQHTKSLGDVRVSSCKITVNQADPNLIGEAKAWLGGADPDGGDATEALYYVKLATGEPAHMAPGDASKSLTTGGFGLLKFQQDDGDVFIVYQTFAK